MPSQPMVTSDVSSPGIQNFSCHNFEQYAGGRCGVGGECVLACISHLVGCVGDPSGAGVSPMCCHTDCFEAGLMCVETFLGELHACCRLAQPASCVCLEFIAGIKAVQSWNIIGDSNDYSACEL